MSMKVKAVEKLLKFDKNSGSGTSDSGNSGNSGGTVNTGTDENGAEGGL